MSYLTQSKLMSTNADTFDKSAIELGNELKTLFAVRGIEPDTTSLDSSDLRFEMKFGWGEETSMTIAFGLMISPREKRRRLDLTFGWPTWTDFKGDTQEMTPAKYWSEYYDGTDGDFMGDDYKLLDEKTKRKWARSNGSFLPESAMASTEGLVKKLERELGIYEAHLPTLRAVSEHQMSLSKNQKEAVNLQKKWFNGYSMDMSNYRHWYANWFHHDHQKKHSVYVEMDTGWAGGNGDEFIPEGREAEVRFVFDEGSIRRSDYADLVAKFAKLANEAVIKSQTHKVSA